MKFNGHRLKKKPITKNVINLFALYTLGPQLRNLNTNFTFGNCLFGSIKLIKNANPDKCKYSGYRIGFQSCSEFSLPDSNMKKMSLFELIWAHL